MYSHQQLPAINRKYEILKRKGMEAIDAFAAIAEKSTELKLIDNKHTNVSFKLLDKVFKIRIEFDPKWIENEQQAGNLRTYRVEENEGETKEIVIPAVEFPYDKLGNIGQGSTCEDFYYSHLDLLIPVVLNDLVIKL